MRPTWRAAGGAHTEATARGAPRQHSVMQNLGPDGQQGGSWSVLGGAGSSHGAVARAQPSEEGGAGQAFRSVSRRAPATPARHHRSSGPTSVRAQRLFGPGQSIRTGGVGSTSSDWNRTSTVSRTAVSTATPFGDHRLLPARFPRRPPSPPPPISPSPACRAVT